MLNLQVNEKMSREQANQLADIVGIGEPDKLPNLEAVLSALKEKQPPAGKPQPEEPQSARDERRARIDTFGLDAQDVAWGAANAAKPEAERDGPLHVAYKARGSALAKNISDAQRPETLGGRAWATTKKVGTVTGILGGTYVVAAGAVKGIARVIARFRGPAL